VAARKVLLSFVRSGRLPLAAGNARIHAIAMVRLRTFDMIHLPSVGGSSG
jgi:hypothetical protein